jgi:hypothetical protein
MIKGKMTWVGLKIWVSLAKEEKRHERKTSKNNIKHKTRLAQKKGPTNGPPQHVPTKEKMTDKAFEDEC